MYVAPYIQNRIMLHHLLLSQQFCESYSITDFYCQLAGKKERVRERKKDRRRDRQTNKNRGEGEMDAEGG